MILDAGEDVGEVFKGIDAARFAGGDERVEAREALARGDVANDVQRQLSTLNGTPALFTWVDGQLTTVIWIECDDNRIVALQVLRNPEKLARLAAVTKWPGSTSLH